MSGWQADLWPDRRAAPRQKEEQRLQEQLAEYLPLGLPRDAIFHHSPGEGLRSPGAQAALIRSGFCAGWPDLEIVWQQRVYFIELKAARGVLSKAQHATHRRLLEAGAPVMLCRSLPAVEAALRACGLPLRASVSA